MSIRACVGVLAVALWGCQAPQPLDTPRVPWLGEFLGPATHVELFSLDTGDPPPGSEPSKEIAGWTVIAGTGELDEPRRQQSKQALQAIIADGEHKGSKCFMPHHALVAEHDGHRLEAVLCFMCKNAELYLDGALRDTVTIGTDGADVLDELLDDASRVGGR